MDGEGMEPPLFQHLIIDIMYPFKYGCINVSLTSKAATNQLESKLGTQDSKGSQQVGSMDLKLVLELGTVLGCCTLNQGG